MNFIEFRRIKDYNFKTDVLKYDRVEIKTQDLRLISWLITHPRTCNHVLNTWQDYNNIVGNHVYQLEYTKTRP